MDSKIGTDVKVSAGANAGAAASPGIVLTTHYKMEAFDTEGNLKWIEEFDNIVPNGGLNDLLTNYLKGSAYTAAFYVGLTDSTPAVAATDTMASHPGWVEVETFSQGVRPTPVSYTHLTLPTTPYV